MMFIDYMRCNKLAAQMHKGTFVKHCEQKTQMIFLFHLSRIFQYTWTGTNRNCLHQPHMWLQYKADRFRAEQPHYSMCPCAVPILSHRTFIPNVQKRTEKNDDGGHVPVCACVFGERFFHLPLQNSLCSCDTSESIMLT